MTFLLDVNCLVALFDGSHVNHEAAHGWFGEVGSRAWATCPITENGFIRVISNPAYPSIAATPNEVLERLLEFCRHPGHLFWPDDVSLLEELDDAVRARLLGHQQLTDFYLAFLALRHDGKLVTFDGSLSRSLAGTVLERTIHVVR
ncbi:MAG: PIN domain-containing protein [Spirochaetes bacterium]|nr:PIN domain-containing protein [Spirochaetota bacterium]